MPASRTPHPALGVAGRVLLVAVAALLAFSCGAGARTSADRGQPPPPPLSAVPTGALDHAATTAHPAQTAQPQTEDDARPRCSKKYAVASKTAVPGGAERHQAPTGAGHAFAVPLPPAGPSCRLHPGGPAPHAPDLDQLSVLRI